MRQQAFHAMLAEFFRITGSADAKTLPGVGHCRCLGRDVALYYDDKVDPSNVHAYVDLGSVTPARQAAVFRTLLLRHPSYKRTHSAVLGLDPHTDRIVLVAQITMDHTLNGQRMSAILTQLIQQAHIWRKPQPAVRFGAGKTRSLRRPS